MTLLDDQITRSQCYDPGLDIRVYVGLSLEVPFDSSSINPTSNLAVGVGTDWIDVTEDISTTVTIDHQEHGTIANFKMNRFDSGLYHQSRRVLIKRWVSGGGTDSGWLDCYYGYLTAGLDIAPDGLSTPFDVRAESDAELMAKANVPSRRYNSNLAKDAQATATSTLMFPEAAIVQEGLTSLDVGPNSVRDGLLASAYLAATAAGVTDYYSPRNDVDVVIDRVFTHAVGPGDNVPQALVIVPCRSMNWTQDYSFNWGNPAGYTNLLELGAIHRNGNQWSLPTVIGPAGTSVKVLRSTSNPNHCHIKVIMDRNHNTRLAYPTLPHHFRIIFKATLPGDGQPHYYRYRPGDGEWKYARLTGDWQECNQDIPGATDGTNATALWMSMQMDAWTGLDATGSIDYSITSIDFAAVQVVSGARLAATYNNQLNVRPVIAGLLSVGYGDLHLEVKDKDGVTLGDINLARYGIAQANGLQPIVITPSRAELETRFNLSGAVVVETGTDYPGVWFDSRPQSGTGYNTFRLYEAAYTQVQRCEPGDAGCVNGTRTVTLLAAVPQDATTISTASGYPSNATQGWRRTPGLSGSFAVDTTPTLTRLTQGSNSETLMLTFPALAYPTLASNVAIGDTSIELIGDTGLVPLAVPWRNFSGGYTLMPGYLLIGTQEYVRVERVEGQSIFITRNTPPPGISPLSAAIAHAAGETLIPMLPDAYPASTYHQQQMPRVAGLTISRMDGVPALEHLVVLVSNLAAATIPTSENDAAWTRVASIEGNRNPVLQVTLGDPRELRKVAVLVYAMAVDPNTGRRARVAINDIAVQGVPNNSNSYRSIARLEDVIAYFWELYGGLIGQPASVMRGRIVIDQSVRYVGIPFPQLTTAAGNLASIMTQLTQAAGLTWYVDAWGRLTICFAPNSGLGFPPGTLPAYTFTPANSSNPAMKLEPPYQISQVALSGVDGRGRSYKEVFPDPANPLGDKQEQSGLMVISPETFRRMARARYYNATRPYSFTVKAGPMEWLGDRGRGKLVVFSWSDVDVYGSDGANALCHVRNYRESYVQAASGWVLTTQATLEQRASV